MPIVSPDSAVYYKKRKAQESVLVTRPACRGLRIAHHHRTSNAEAHADMNIYTKRRFTLTRKRHTA